MNVKLTTKFASCHNYEDDDDDDNDEAVRSIAAM